MDLRPELDWHLDLRHRTFGDGTGLDDPKLGCVGVLAGLPVDHGQQPAFGLRIARGDVRGFVDINEPAHIPSRDPQSEGWLLTVVDRKTGEDTHTSELWIVEAGAVAKGPVAKIKVPVQLRPQVHGTWVPAAALAASRR